MLRRRSPEERVALERAKQIRRQVEAIQRAERSSWTDGRTLEDELRQLLEALGELKRTIVAAIRAGR